jgi:hypothetical protein
MMLIKHLVEFGNCRSSPGGPLTQVPLIFSSIDSSRNFDHAQLRQDSMGLQTPPNTSIVTRARRQSYSRRAVPRQEYRKPARLAVAEVHLGAERHVVSVPERLSRCAQPMMVCSTDAAAHAKVLEAEGTKVYWRRVVRHGKGISITSRLWRGWPRCRGHQMSGGGSPGKVQRGANLPVYW